MQILIWPGQAHFLIISPHLFFGQTCANDCKVDSSTSNRTVDGTSYLTPIFFFKQCRIMPACDIITPESVKPIKSCLTKINTGLSTYIESYVQLDSNHTKYY